MDLLDPPEGRKQYSFGDSLYRRRLSSASGDPPEGRKQYSFGDSLFRRRLSSASGSYFVTG